MDEPNSEYSAYEIIINWVVLREQMIDPPTKLQYFLSIGAITLIFIVGGDKAVISLLNLSGIPGNNVFPPDRMIFQWLEKFITNLNS